MTWFLLKKAEPVGGETCSDAITAVPMGSAPVTSSSVHYILRALTVLSPGQQQHSKGPAVPTALVVTSVHSHFSPAPCRVHPSPTPSSHTGCCRADFSLCSNTLTLPFLDLPGVLVVQPSWDALHFPGCSGLPWIHLGFSGLSGALLASLELSWDLPGGFFPSFSEFSWSLLTFLTSCFFRCFQGGCGTSELS